MGIKNKENFIYHYELELNNGRCACGPGSEFDKVKEAGTLDFINYIIKKYAITSINDCGCGLFENWMFGVDLDNVTYTGYDINNLAIERNIIKYPERMFFEFDIVNNKLPYADLIICRDCFFHLPDIFVINTLKKFKDSGAKFLLATEHNWLKCNVDLNEHELKKEAGFRFINLEISPFNLGVPLNIHNEEVWRYYEGGNNRQVAVRRL